MENKISCYCVQLRLAANEITKQYNACLEPVGLSINQFFLLSSLNRLGACNVSQLAQQTQQDRTTLVRTLRPLLAQGLIADEAKKGKRDRILVLTSQGQSVLAAARPLWQQAQQAMEQKLGPDKLNTLEEILAHLTK